MLRWLLLVTVTAVSLLGLAGCNSKSESESGPTAPASPRKFPQPGKS
jgi:hypothetical protein